jgi:hypothetical protein
LVTSLAPFWLQRISSASFALDVESVEFLVDWKVGERELTEEDDDDMDEEDDVGLSDSVDCCCADGKLTRLLINLFLKQKQVQNFLTQKNFKYIV